MRRALAKHHAVAMRELFSDDCIAPRDAWRDALAESSASVD
jgi:hypothetical protein